MKLYVIAWLFLAGLFLCISCQNNTEKVFLEWPNYFPDTIQKHDFINAQKIELGRKLFYERALSIDSSISCASCHQQKFAFSDPNIFSKGAHDSTGFRNSQGLQNLLFKSHFFRDGGVNTIKRATIPPMQTDFEMNLNIREALDRINSDSKYLKGFKKIYHKPANHANVLECLSAFQLTLISDKSKYDNFLNQRVLLNEEELAGKQLFFSDKLNCAICHSGVLFSDEKAHNIGLYTNYKDYGLGRVTLDSSDFGKFITPSLRNIQLTAPYMHNGSMATLEEVIAFYATGGVTHPNKSKLLQKFEISPTETQQLIAFLKTLTDSVFIQNPAFSNPYKTE